MAKELKVYLDRHIPRDNLLYKPSSDKITHENSKEFQPRLQLSELFGEDAKNDLLRKPDFQRATSAWTPEECVSLLVSVLTEQVIPSIIMWRSPENHWYVLDGGHRLSVVLAWLQDDWGENLASEEYMDEELEKSYKQAAKEVKRLLAKAGIKPFREYQKAYKDYRKIEPAHSHGDYLDFQFGLDSETSKLIEFYRAIKGNAGLPLQWVTGDYSKAKESFLNINKSGRKLTDWERKLVEYRDSSLARTVMSVALTSNAAHCWPSQHSRMSSLSMRQDIENILDEAVHLHSFLFDPPYDSKFSRPQQPLLVESRTEPDTKAAYLAELLTVVKGQTGRDAQTEKLLKQDQSASEVELVKHGLLLIRNGISVCEHLIGSSSQPISLSIVPALYFYSDTGQHIRSLLYGFIYWLFYGDDDRITFERKLLFTTHRAAFEKVLLEKKQSYVSAFSRKVGSGSEVTVKMAKYYNHLLRLLIKYQDDIEAEGFIKEYEDFLKKKHETERTSSGKHRTFSKQQKSAIARHTWLTSLPTCAICGGLLDLTIGTQYDHVQEHSKGGMTVTENGRPTYPFCNNNRWTIERIKNDQEVITLPAFIDSVVETSPEYMQLSFLTDLDYDDYDSPLSSMADM